MKSDDWLNKKPRILLVDDTPESLALLSTVLDFQDARVSFATNGNEAIRIAKTIKPDLILLDVMMPGLNGYDICKILKADADTLDIPVIFLTARDDESDIIQGFQSGGVDYVTKPFKNEELVARVKTHLELKRSRDIIREQKERLERSNAALKTYTTEITNLNSALLASQNDLKAMVEMKDKFFAIISHDLRSPFSGFLGVTEFLAFNPDPMSMEEMKGVTKELNKSARILYSLIENLLAWAQAQTNTLKCELSSQNLHACINSAVEQVHNFAQGKKIIIVNNVDTKNVAVFDPVLLKTVVRNLLINAVKYSYPQSTIEIESNVVANNAVAVSVIDHGVGMKQKQIESLFRIDVKQSTPGTAAETGTGLGLHLCKEFLQKQGGTITATSELGTGSVFTFTLPLSGRVSPKLDDNEL